MLLYLEHTIVRPTGIYLYIIHVSNVIIYMSPFRRPRLRKRPREPFFRISETCTYRKKNVYLRMIDRVICDLSSTTL